MKGAMNIDFSEKYDQEDDVYYVSFKKIRKTVEDATKNLQSAIRSREDQLERKLEEVLA